MRGRQILFLSLLAIAVVAIAGIPTKSQIYEINANGDPDLIAGRNVNMVSGITLPDGDPWLQRQNEPSIAVSTRNPLHLLAGANDYRTVDIPFSEGELPGKIQNQATGDAWLGIFKSFDGGQSWISTLLPGFPQDTSLDGDSSPLKYRPGTKKGYRVAADPIVRAGTNGLFYLCGIAFNRDDDKNVVFVSRFIDNNNEEGGDSIKYLDTKILAEGNKNRFLDKPWMIVDQPYSKQTVTISGQRIPKSYVYVAYAGFSGEGADLKSDIWFVRSSNCGKSWSVPEIIGEGENSPNQGVTIGVDPRGNKVLYVAWRRFASSAQSDPHDSIIIAKSTNRGGGFREKDIVEVARLEGPFDQPSTDQYTNPLGTSFRTNSYPTIAVDRTGRIYIAWTQRNIDPASLHDSRILISSSQDGSTWITPMSVESPTQGPNDPPCYQFMPSMTFAGGRLILAWYDTRNDYCEDYFPPDYISDSGQIRHTVDVRVAQAFPGDFPVFRSSVQVSKYLWVMWGSPGSYYFSQAQFNPLNYPLFMGGTVPFHGDYIDIAPSPRFIQDANGSWRFNNKATDSQQFHLAWTDNRDVRPPVDNNWEIYNPPSSAQTLSQSRFYVSTDCSDARNTGARNQNIYTSLITSVMDAGSPGNNKPLGTLGTNPTTGDLIPRAFVIFVKNPTEDIRHYRLQITDGPDRGTASFLEFDMLDEVDVSIAPFSSISRPLFVTSSDENDTVTVDVFEITEPGGVPEPGGAQSTIVINPDETNPDVTGNLATTETHDPDIANPNIVNWTYVNPNIVNPNIVNPNIVNPNIVNPNIVNPNIVNPNIVNPNIVNPNIVNPNIVNPNIVNPNIVNPNIVNSSIEDAEVTDIEWAVTNAGNTVSSYTFKIFARESLPQGIYAQLLVYKIHYTPATDGASCNLKQTPHHELLLNIVNPNIVNPNIVNPNIVNPNIVNSAIENATFFLSPGDEAKAVLRLIDPDPGVSKFLQSGRKFKIQQFAQSLGAATGSQAVDSTDAQQGETTTEADSTELIIITAGLLDGTVDEIYPNSDFPGIQLQATGGDGTYVWSANSAHMPPGLGCGENGIIGGVPQFDPDATYPKIYSFIVQVTSAGENATQNLSITINSADDPTPPLNIETTTLTPGTVGVYYGATLQATGGMPPRTWSIVAGSLPLGLSLDSGGVISGTIVDDDLVSYPHDYTFTVQVTDADMDTDTQPLIISVDEIIYPDLTISGTITDENGSAVSGVSIYGLPSAPQTDSYGFYSDNVPYNWSGEITPFKSGYDFQVSLIDPSPSRTYYEITSDQYSQDFVATSLNYTISGRVTFYGTGLEGVVMNGLPGTPQTNGNGFYHASVPFHWSGTVIPELLDYIFQPSNRTYDSIEADYVLQDYTATFVGAGQDDPFEDNDSLGAATDLDPGTYTNLQLHDDDWYRVDIAQGNDLKVFVDGEHPNNIDVEILNGVGNRIIGAYGDSEDVTVYATGLPSGSHYIHVIYLGTSGFWNAYDLIITTGTDLGNGDISGNISTSGDDSLADVEVTAYDTQSDHYFATTTDANGDYRISLPPSPYKLYFDAGAIGPPNYVSEYYDNQLTFDNADVIDVQAGMLILGIDAALELETVLSIVTTTLPSGNLATPYSAQLEATGGQLPYTWELADGSEPLPDGLVLHSSGLIDGTPSTLGLFSFTVELTDASPTSITRVLSITITTYAGTEYVISGTVTPALAGVVMSGLPGDPETNASGEYTALVYSGWSGTVTPILAGNAFDPASRTYSNVNSSFTGENYTASTGFTISGQVTLSGSPLEGVLMSGLPGDPYTDVSGLYSMAVPSGWTDTVTPTLPGFSFTPPNISYSNVTADQPGQNYTTSFQGGQDDIYEDNDDFASAAEVTLGTHTGLVLSDEDWFKIYIPAGNEDKDLKINIQALSYPEPNGYEDIDLIAVDASEQMLGYTLSSSDNETLYLTDVEEGWYYFGQNYISQPGTVYSVTLELSDNFSIGYISGRITDETTGQPIEGIYVEIHGQPFDWANPRPLITTDANGEYKIGFIPGNYVVQFNNYLFNQAWAPDRNYIPKSYNSSEILTIIAGSTISGIDDQLQPGGTIAGRITDPAGNGLNNALAYVYSSDNTQVSYSWTDGSGYYAAKRLPTGNYKIRARGGPYGSMWYDGKGSLEDGHPVPAQVGMTTSNIDLQLEESAVIEGQVTDGSQNPIQGVVVRVYDVSGIALWSNTTNADGYFWLGRRLPTGDVKIYFDASSAQGNYASEYHSDKLLIENADPIPVQAGQTISDFNAVLADGGTISGRVTDAQNDSFPGVAVHCIDIDSDRFYYATTDADGNYTIFGLLPDNYKVRFRINSGNYATLWYGGNSFDEGTNVSVGAGANVSGIDAKLIDNGGFISGRVTNTSGNGIQDVRVLAQDVTKEAGIAWTETDADGYYTIPRIPTCNAKVYFNSDRQYLNYVAEWYNDAGSHTSAGTVAVIFNQETPNVNAVLAPVPAVNITTTSLLNGEVAVPYEVVLEATGGREFYHWSIISGTLPPGLMFNSKGEITGAPTTTGTHNFTVRVTDSSRNQQRVDTQTLSLSIDTYQGTGYLISGLVELDNLPLGGVVLQGLPGNPATAPNGEYIVAVSQGWSGTVTPTHSGYFFDPQNRSYSDVDSSISEQDYTAYELTLQITTEWLLNGTEGYPYNQSLHVEGGTGPYSWSITSGNLPYGLTLDSNGTISGTPTQSDNYDFTARVTDSSIPVSQYVEKELSIQIHGDPVSDNPLLYWKLDEGDGTIAQDSSGHNDNGALNGNVTYTADSVDGHAADIQANGWIDRTHEGFFHFTNQATIMARVKIEDFSQPNRFVWKLQYDEPYRGHPYAFEILMDINGSMLHLDSGNGLIQDIFNCPHYQIDVDLSDPQNGFTLGAYNQIAVTVNGDVYNVFINGDLVETQTGAPFEVHDSLQHFWVGGAEWSEYWLGGKIDEIMVFNMTFEPQDILEIFNLGVLPTISGTVRLSDGSPLPWVRMNDLGDVQVQENGQYIGVVAPGWSGTVTPEMGGYFFTPPNRSYNNVIEDITGHDYTAYEQGALWVETNSIPSGKKGDSYSTTLVAADGVPTYIWSVVSGSLPTGLTLNSDGVISGTPTEAGDFSFTARVLDSDSPPRAAEQYFTFFISAAHQGFWTTTYPFGGNMHSTGLALDHSDPDVIFASAGSRGIYHSIDAAASWNNLIEDPSWPYGESDYQYFLIHQVSGNYYTCTGGRIYRSTDSGETWEQIYETEDWDISTLTIDPTSATASIIYVGTWNGEMFKTTDGGTNWSATGAGLPDNEITVITVNPATPATLYAGTNNSGIYKSVDSGANWLVSNGTTDFSWVEDIKIDPTGNIYVMAWTHQHGGGTYHSVDGASWVRLLTANPDWSPGNSIAIDPTDPDIIYVASNQDVIKTYDAGSNWTTYSVSSAQTEAIIIDPTSPQNQTLYAATGGEGVWKSVDGGAIWAKASNGIRALGFSHDDPHSLEFDETDPNYIYSGSINGGYRSLNGGSTWEKMDHPAGSILALLTHPGAPGNVYSYHNSLDISADNGSSGSWVTASGFSWGFSRGDIGMAADDPNIIYVGTWGSDTDPTGVYKTTNGGTTFTLMNIGLDPSNTEIQTIAVHPGVEPGDHDIIFVGLRRDWPFIEGIDYGVYKTTDGGANWDKITCGLPDDFFARQILFTPSNPNTMFMLGETEHDCGFYESTDGGNCWTKLSDYCGNSIAVDPSNSDLVYMGAWDGFYVSLNGGADWIEFNDGLPRNPGIDPVAVDPLDPRHVFIGTAAGVYEAMISADFSITTENLPTGIVGEPYIAGIEARGGTYPISWEIVSGELPAGFTFNDLGTTSEIEGTSFEPGYWEITIKATDNSGNSYTKRFDLNIYNKYILTVGTNPQVGGNVTVDPDQPWYIEGSMVDVSASPAGSYSFVGWSGDASGRASLVHVDMTRDKTLTANFALPGTLPDYDFSAFDAPASARSGETINGSVTAVARNQGATDTYTGDISVGIYLSPNPEITTSDILLWKGRTSIQALDGSDITSVSISPDLQIPTTVTPGTYSIGVLVDEYDVIAEQNEDNNFASLAITITSPGDGYFDISGVWSGGSTYGLAADEARNLAFVGHGSTLEVLDISNPSNPHKISELYISPLLVTGIVLSGNWAYLSCGTEGLVIVNVSDPYNPLRMGNCDTVESYARSVDVSGNYAYIADYHHGLRVINVSNPASPTEVGFLPMSEMTREVRIFDNFVYATVRRHLATEGIQGLRVIDVSTPSNPVLRSTYEIPDGVGIPDMDDSGRYLFVPDYANGVRILDVQDPDALVEVAFYGGASFPSEVEIIGNHAFVDDNAEDKVVILDITDPLNPTEISSYWFGDSQSLYGFEVVGDLWLVNRWYDSIRVLDISNLNSPQEVGSYDDVTGLLYYVDTADEHAFVVYTKSQADGMKVLDYSNPSAITEKTTVPTPYGIYDIEILGNYAYLPTYENGLRVMDISNPSNPVEVGVCDDIQRALDIAISGNYIYAACRQDGLKIVDISTPTNPIHKSTWDTPVYAYAVAIQGNFAYVSDNRWWSGLRIIDISDPLNPWEVGSLEFEDDVFRIRHIAVRGNYVYLAQDYKTCKVIDVSDPENCVEVASFETYYAVNLAVSGDFLFVSDWLLGLRIMDISDPTNPTQVDLLNEFSGVWGVKIKENKIYLVNRDSSFVILEYKRPVI